MWRRRVRRHTAETDTNGCVASPNTERAISATTPRRWVGTRGSSTAARSSYPTPSAIADAAHEPADVPRAGAVGDGDAAAGQTVRDADAVADAEHAAAPVHHRERVRPGTHGRVPVEVDVAGFAVLVCVHCTPPFATDGTTTMVATPCDARQSCRPGHDPQREGTPSLALWVGFGPSSWHSAIPVARAAAAGRGTRPRLHVHMESALSTSISNTPDHGNGKGAMVEPARDRPTDAAGPQAGGVGLNSRTSRDRKFNRAGSAGSGWSETSWNARTSVRVSW